MIEPRRLRLALLIVLVLSCAGGAAIAGEGPIPPGGAAVDPDSSASAREDSLASVPSDSTASAPGDTAEAAAADTTVVDIFAPTWTSSMKGNDSELTLRTGSTVRINAPNGWMFFSTTNIQKRTYRLRDTDELSEDFMNTATKLDPDRYTFTLRVGNNYMRKTLVGLARFGKDFVVDTDNASFDFVLRRALLGAKSSQISASGDARRGPNDFKYDRAITGAAGTYLRYRFGDELWVTGGFGTSRIREESEIGSTIRFDGMPSRTDTIRANVDYGTGKDKPFHLEYRRIDGVIRRVTLPRGNSLELLDDPEAAQREEEHKMGQSLKVTSFVQPLSYVSVDLSFEHDANEQMYRVDTRLNNDSEGTTLGAKVVYNYAARGAMSFDIENGRNDVDYGPISLASYRQKDKKIGMGMRQQLGDSLSVVLRGAMSLNQRFLKKYESNPRDQDIMVYGGGGNISSVPFRSIKAMVDFTFTRRETVNIDRTLSGDNRIDFFYQFIPSVSVTPFAWAKVRQDYTLKFETTEFVFNEENNTLNRTIGVETTAELSVLSPVRFVFIHEYRKRDTGSYLQRGGERLYGRSGETLDNELDLRLAYRPLQGLTLSGAASFQTQESKRLKREGAKTVVASSNTYDSGALRIGVERQRSIGAVGELNLTIDYVRRFGPTITELRREYWIVDTELKFSF